jgi:hypothetical protein
MLKLNMPALELYTHNTASFAGRVFSLIPMAHVHTLPTSECVTNMSGHA